MGNFLYFFNEYSWSCVFASTNVIELASIWSFHKLKINFFTAFKPWSINNAPIKASRESEIILSAILIFFLLLLEVRIKFSRLITLAIWKHLFLLTRDANFLSNVPSFSFGKISNNFSDITNPKTLSPKNSSFSLLFIEL